MSQKTEQCRSLVVVKIRGTVRAQKETRETLEFLHLVHTNHSVIIDSRASYLGMLQRVNSYITYGEPTKELVAMMLQKRARLAGDKKQTDEYIQKIGYKSKNFQKLKHVLSYIRQAKDTKAKPKRVSKQAAKQATEETQ